jgi:hypothetical protein
MLPALVICATLVVCVVLSISASAKEHRSASVKREFQLTIHDRRPGKRVDPVPVTSRITSCRSRAGA